MPNRLGVVRAVAAALGRARTEPEVADIVLNAVSIHLGACTASVWLISGDGTEMTLAYERNADPEAIARFARIPIDSDLPGPTIHRSGEPVFVRSRAERDERWPAIAGTPSPSEALAVLPLRADGIGLGVVSFGFPVEREFDSSDCQALATVADQCAIALDRARLYEALRAEADVNHLLARIGALGGVMGWRTAAQQAVTAVVDEFVDSCALYLREAGVVRRTAVASRTYAQAFADLLGRASMPLSAATPVASAVRTGQPVHLPPSGADTDSLESTDPAPPWRFGPVHFGDAWVLPMFDGARAIGAMLFATEPGRAELSREELRVAGEVAARTATVLRSAAEFSRHRATVDALLEVLVPNEPPVIDGLELSACYVPYVEGPNVGGDWWDALVLRDGRVAISVGDVAGHGLGPAAIVGQLRNALRSYLLSGATPGQALAELGALLDWTNPSAHATAAVTVIDPRTGRFEVASAAHPPPLLIEGGRARFLDITSTPPLGITDRGGPWHYGEMAGVLAPHATLHLYTDGLVEGHHRPIDVGLALLADESLRCASDDLQSQCEQLVANLVAVPDDDICLLLARRRPLAESVTG